MKYLLTIIILVAACAKDNEPEENRPVDLSPLRVVGDLYCEKSRAAYEEKQYVHSKCDGSGFTSLYSVRCPNVNLDIFNGPERKLYRSPSHDCLSEKLSRAESSRDMVLMRAVSAFIHRDLDWVSGFLDFIDTQPSIPFGGGVFPKFCDHDGTIDGKSRCRLTPGLHKLLKDLRAYLRGGSRLASSEVKLSLLRKEGFAAHIEVLFIWLSGQIHDGISDIDLWLLKSHAEAEPWNALFQAVYHRYSDGDMSAVFAILNAWPKDRLPNTTDWCGEYLNQRDSGGKDWKPCMPFSEHSGTDFNLALFVAEGKKHAS